MAEFIIHFILCNLLISGIIGLLFIARRIFRHHLSGRMQYNLWFVLLGILAVPFFPSHFTGLTQLFPWLTYMRRSPASNTGTAIENAAGTTIAKTAAWINDFTLSVNREFSSITGLILFGIWSLGVFTMILLTIKSLLRLRRLENSALPLQNLEIRKLYRRCLNEMKLTNTIPVYSSAFVRSPMITGCLKPRIFLPIRLISDYKERDLRFMLLHELQHYKHKDTFANPVMNLIGILYWFNPVVLHALKEMCGDREIACDSSVLQMLKADDYEAYGNTLINFTEKLSRPPIPFAAGLGGTMKQMKRRVVNIATYEKPTVSKQLKGLASFALITSILLGSAPLLSAFAAEDSYFHWETNSKHIAYADLSAYFGAYKGSFVLYDTGNDSWTIYNRELAALRTAPDSTYKVYDALFGLEEGIITPEDSAISWNGKAYPFPEWNADQTLGSAMSSSVNWYFQTLDKRLGSEVIRSYIQKIGYGNQRIDGSLSSYWLESSLKISPIEQIELLRKLQDNSFGFAPENIAAVKDSIRLASFDTAVLYGKTGTGRINGQDVNGWFVGFVETPGRSCFFAVNIGAKKDANGSSAAEIAMSILTDRNIWTKK